MESIGKAAARLLAGLEARVAEKKAAGCLEGRHEFSDRQPQAMPGGSSYPAKREDGTSPQPSSRLCAQVSAANQNERGHAGTSYGEESPLERERSTVSALSASPSDVPNALAISVVSFPRRNRL